MKKGIDLTDEQIKRQINRLRKMIFSDYEEFEDGSYTGDLNEDVLELIATHIPVGEELSEFAFIEVVQNCAKELYEWLESNVNSVDKRLMALYCFDFINQSLSTIYAIEFIDNDGKDDPMYA